LKPILMASPFVGGLEYVSIKNWVGRVVVILITGSTCAACGM